jgi:hypothetical protein
MKTFAIIMLTVDAILLFVTIKQTKMAWRMGRIGITLNTCGYICVAIAIIININILLK